MSNYFESIPQVTYKGPDWMQVRKMSHPRPVADTCCQAFYDKPTVFCIVLQIAVGFFFI